MTDLQKLIQYRTYVVRRALEVIDLWSPSAENLVLGTGLQESGYELIDQMDFPEKPGPAYGFWQIEKPTFRDIWDNFLTFRQHLRARVLSLCMGDPKAPDAQTELHGNAFLGAALCRIIYYRAPARLPDATDARTMAEYWKRYYNTPLGKGTVEVALPKFQLVCRYDR